MEKIKKESSRYWDIINSVDYLAETCCECDGEFVGNEIKAFLCELYSKVGGKTYEQ